MDAANATDALSRYIALAITTWHCGGGNRRQRWPEVDELGVVAAFCHRHNRTF
jgi:hypothetical protein